ncbi:5'-adenylylsulfate reductase-like 4 [Cucurbita argyrosperma subsp. argyrosperma]|nr:5'-adenylylsulfate reductase-like 4 [Cucurbita argyrosperma subsp. argyrosperma]
MRIGFCVRGIVLLIVMLGRQASSADSVRVLHSGLSCPIESFLDTIFRFRDWNSYCPIDGQHGHYEFIGVSEGDEASLQMALNMVHKNRYEYVAVLFYASWCQFSKSFRPSFSILSSLYPSIPHFAIQESAVRPSILSKYGVHGFPTLFLLNSTMRARYYGSRTLPSLAAFYNDVTGIQTASLDQISPDRIEQVWNQEKHDDSSEQENCPFSWARSPENLLREETYLALATAFVCMRLIYIFFPTLLVYAQYVWQRHLRNLRLGTLWERPLTCLKGAVQLFSHFKDPCKRSNLQGGAMNARAWAKSFATVSIGDASSSSRVCQ